MILSVIGVKPAEFFAELYGLSGPYKGASESVAGRPAMQGESVVAVGGEYVKFEALLQGLAGLLVSKKIVTREELRAAVEAISRGE